MKHTPADDKEIAKLFTKFTQHIDSFMYLAAHCFPENDDRKTKAGKVIEKILETLEEDIGEMKVEEIRKYVKTVEDQIAEFKIIVTH